jgi:8-oxo-(d)GTP phosphatase
MGDSPAGELAQIRAAGAILWRPAADGVEVALVHRPKYDDWSLPKGKLSPGEHMLRAAVREVGEETGILVNLGRRLPSTSYLARGAAKVVDYWAATADGAVPEFSPNSEVDWLAWLPPAEAGRRLSYEHDLGVLAAFTAGPPRTVPLILVRHASAGSKSEWPGEDEDRPLDAQGWQDAEQLAGLLRSFGVCRTISSPSERSMATVRPYAAATGGQVEREPAFRVAKDSPPVAPSDIAQATARLVAARQPLVICGHRENLQVMLGAACAELGADLPAVRPLRKGEFLVLHRADGKLAAVECYHPRELWLPGPVIITETWGRPRPLTCRDHGRQRECGA